MTTNTRPLVIYHAPCADGFGAAWCFWKKYGDGADYHPAKYGKPAPDVKDRTVFMADFTFPPPVLAQMAREAASITVLDHHKSAMLEAFTYFDQAGPEHEHYSGWFTSTDPEGALQYVKAENLGTEANLHLLFDMNRSGARMAWDYLFPHESPPPLLLHIEDRDLWRFKLAHTREIQSTVFSHPYDFKLWDRLMKAGPLELMEMTVGGAAIDRAHQKNVSELFREVRRYMVINGVETPVANVPYTMASDMGQELADFERARKLRPASEVFAATYFDDATHRCFSLRSLDDGADVSVIAKRYGGGGHARAAGFKVPRDHRLAQC
jgi:oligoribonuclease NrnB/cAMP/cGMP phosphodiesterase (DHH superfamily)